ncbi:GOLPH3/VPS74 family protein [Microbacterium sp.]|uniref:GOLPH3/VPS74 family protein n=1 Tax=Microbacterium sp. TaxID=51671 RepID=UPI003F721AA4
MNDSTPERAIATRHGITDDLMLLLFDPHSGTIAGEGTLFYVLAGALLSDLALEGLVRTEGDGLGGPLVLARSDAAPDDELLRTGWQYVVDKPRRVQTVLAAVGPQLRGPVLDRLVARGDLARTRGRVLGILPTERLRLGVTGRREALVANARAALVDGAEPDSRTAALVALLSASGSLPSLWREIPWTGPVAERARAFERGDVGADGAAEAVARTMAAIVVNSLVAASVIAPR